MGTSSGSILPPEWGEQRQGREPSRGPDLGPLEFVGGAYALASSAAAARMSLRKASERASATL
jgi:hypothetical protein